MLQMFAMLYCYGLQRLKSFRSVSLLIYCRQPSSCLVLISSCKIIFPAIFSKEIISLVCFKTDDRREQSNHKNSLPFLISCASVDLTRWAFFAECRMDGFMWVKTYNISYDNVDATFHKYFHLWDFMDVFFVIFIITFTSFSLVA